MIVAAWTVFGLLHAAFWLLTSSLAVEGDPPVPAGMPLRYMVGILATALLLAWAWAALTPVIFRLTELAAPRRVGWFAAITMHTGAFAVIASGMTALRHTLLPLLSGEPPGVTLLSRLVFLLDVQLFTYLAVVLTGRAIASHRRYVDRALRAHVLETQLARAQLHFLELQLQPHFLFNSLNTIQELAHESPNAAERMLRRLHALLAMSLERSGRDEVSLADELAALEPYVDIQRTRFDWLSVQIQADDEARAALVPHLILQPLVENAIRHGLAVRNGPGHIEVAARRVGDRLLLRVQDDGVGLAPLSDSARRGIGLRNASERLRQLHGGDHRFELAEAPGGGVRVEIDIPYRRAENAPAPTLWTEARHTRETVPEITMEEISAWRTGEFETAVTDSEAAEMRREAARVRAARDNATVTAEEDRRAVRPAAVFETVARSSEPAPPLLPLRTWLALVVFWLGAAALWTVQIQGFAALLDGAPFRWSANTARLQLAGAMYWIAVSVGVLFLARRFRLGRRRFLLHLAIHLATAVLVSFGFLWVLQALRFTSDPILNPFNINPLTGNFFIYFGLLAWSHARDFVAWYRSHEITSVQLTSQIARSRFQALCVQVRPQFLLGTLDLLARLVHVDVPRTERLIARVADVLRLTLDMAREHTTSLQQELQLLTASVEAHRLGIRPNVRLETSIDPAALATPMPSRLLCTMVDDLLAAEPEGPGASTRAVPPLAVRVTAERASDATRIRLRGDTDWKTGSTELHAWWRKKSAAEAAVADAGPLVTVAFPDQATAVLIVADEPVAARESPAAA
ncbi:MAG TPA: histidine kinase [Gemmatimonadaceae bacterium]|nr:histidine kinase [Gemmatimonadaceae bacterium]